MIRFERLGPTSARNLHLACRRVQKLAMFADGGMKATGRGQSIRGNAKFSSAARRDGNADCVTIRGIGDIPNSVRRRQGGPRNRPPDRMAN